jgi:hypothetical protein
MGIERKGVYTVNGNDLIRYVTENLVKYFDKPKLERKQMRHKKKNSRPPFLYRWFGIIPYAILALFKKK